MTEIRRVLITYTGGTIGMQKTQRGFAPAPGQLAKELYSMPQFQDPSQAQGITSPSRFGARVQYEIVEDDPLVDSSNMQIEDWVRIARTIEDNYANYDGFVVLHGTDTMAYTASALSFMLVNLSKTVVLTGSQIPLSASRNDAIDNLLSSLTIAAHYQIPEVCVYFHHQLLFSLFYILMPFLCPLIYY